MNAKREAMIVTKMPIVQTQLVLTTARAGLATQAMGAFVKVKICWLIFMMRLYRVGAYSSLW